MSNDFNEDVIAAKVSSFEASWHGNGCSLQGRKGYEGYEGGVWESWGVDELSECLIEMIFTPRVALCNTTLLSLYEQIGSWIDFHSVLWERQDDVETGHA